MMQDTFVCHSMRQKLTSVPGSGLIADTRQRPQKVGHLTADTPHGGDKRMRVPIVSADIISIDVGRRLVISNLRKYDPCLSRARAIEKKANNEESGRGLTEGSGRMSM